MEELLILNSNNWTVADQFPFAPLGSVNSSWTANYSCGDFNFLEWTAAQNFPGKRQKVKTAST